MHQFKAIGISYKDTPLDVREAVAFEETSTKKFLIRLKEVLGIDEAMVLSTCNRTEIYYHADKNLDRQIASLVDIFHGNTEQPSVEYFQSLDEEAAALHLFRVALGIESMILGDIQITNQVKKAYQWSADESMAGPFLHRLLHTIFYTNKRVVQETPFRDGTASLASSAVDVAEQYLMHFDQPKIAVIGLGDIGANVAENLKSSEAEITLVNRTEEKAEALAKQLGYKTRSISELEDIITASHVVITSVQVSDPIISVSSISTNTPKLLIDLGVPRNIDDQVNDLPGILLYNVDQLQQKASAALDRRKATIPRVEEIVAESLEEFKDWSQEMEVSPTIKKFKEALESIRNEELARYVGKLDDKEMKVLDKISKNMIQKVIKLPVLQLKAACKRGEAESLVGVLNDLFNLESVETKKTS